MLDRMAHTAYFLRMIQTQMIDPSTCKFLMNKTIATGEFSVEAPQNANVSPVARKLFGFPWVEKLAIGTDSLTLTKKDWVDWDIILEPLSGLLEEHFSGEFTVEQPLPQISPNSIGTSTEAESVREFIENQINPALASHGGFIELKSFENHVAYLAMGGGCQGCASSQATMFDGVENALKNQFPFVHRVVDMTDHASGDNPYYS